MVFILKNQRTSQKTDRTGLEPGWTGFDSLKIAENQTGPNILIIYIYIYFKIHVSQNYSWMIFISYSLLHQICGNPKDLNGFECFFHCTSSLLFLSVTLSSRSPQPLSCPPLPLPLSVLSLTDLFLSLSRFRSLSPPLSQSLTLSLSRFLS